MSAAPLPACTPLVMVTAVMPVADEAPPSFSVGGAATGQTGPVTLTLNATNPVSTQNLVVPQAAANFTFTTLLPQGANWAATVTSSPAGQLCTLTNASGNAIAANVTNVNLSCATVTVTVNPASLPDGTFSTAYSQTLTASSANGGTPPYTFATSAGALPAGLTLSPAGVLSGTPTLAGSFNFTVQATSSNGFSGTRAYTVNIAQASQSITNFTANPANPMYSAGGTFSVAANGGPSGQPVVFSVAAASIGICSLSGPTTITILAPGTCSLRANQAGNANYSAAIEAILNVNIGQPVPVPTLSEWALIGLAFLITMAGLANIRRRQG